MDAYTLEHLRKWIMATVARYEDEADGILAGMTAYLAASDDAEYLIGQGWTKVYDNAETAGYLQS